MLNKFSVTNNLIIFRPTITAVNENIISNVPNLLDHNTSSAFIYQVKFIHFIY